MAPVMQAARETFELARDTLSHSFGIPNGNAQAQLEQCDLECCQAIVAARPLPADQRLMAIKDALSAAAGRRARMAAADADATVKRLETEAACRRVLENGLGYRSEESFAAMAVLDDGEKSTLAAIDAQPLDNKEAKAAAVTASQAVFDAASARIQSATEAAVENRGGAESAEKSETPSAESPPADPPA